MTSEHFQTDILGTDPLGQAAGQLYPPDLGHTVIESFTHHGQGDIEAAHAHGEHAEAAGSGRVTVAAD
ncbi:hypothetical protein GCM10014715_72820 [Streptomyces spiralis]|uniref:Uncharacterized protein n=1 Tax=Streptomyces spiralis TaxID=66376 RepID=A0A919AHA6_9ACTN|nr:hypothetical protein GCM10014715_72820 [Streptomyces spiralis]